MLRLWLTLRDPVGPREYLWSGLGLMALKYAVDAGAVWLALPRLWTPFNYFVIRPYGLGLFLVVPFLLGAVTAFPLQP